MCVVKARSVLETIKRPFYDTVTYRIVRRGTIVSNHRDAGRMKLQRLHVVTSCQHYHVLCGTSAPSGLIETL